MAFGFTPKFGQTLDLTGLDPKVYLAIALDAARQLEWDINYTSRSGFTAIIGGGLFSTIEEFKVVISDGSVLLSSKRLSSGMFDWGKNKQHVEDFTQKFDEIQGSVDERQLTEKVADLDPIIKSTEQDKLAHPPTAKDNFKEFLSFFTPREGYFITPIVININIAVFVLMVISGVSFIVPTTADLLSWGANFRVATLSGQWWRLITNVFLHIGILHLLLNMYALLYIGLLLEPYLGKAKFAVAYLATGVLASLSSIYWHPVTVSAGASGAIFGMYGVFLAMLTTNLIDRLARKPLLVSISVFVVYNLMNGVKEGIDNAAHIGGLVSGLLMGYIYYPALRQPLQTNIKYISISGAIVGFAIASIIIYKQIPSDILKYEAKMKTFTQYEQSALQIYQAPKNASKFQLVTMVDNGLNNWNKSLKLLKGADSLDVPVDLLIRNDSLKKYCKLRIISYKLIKKAIDENTSIYKDSIELYTRQIETLITNIKGK